MCELVPLKPNELTAARRGCSLFVQVLPFAGISIREKIHINMRIDGVQMDMWGMYSCCGLRTVLIKLATPPPQTQHDRCLVSLSQRSLGMLTAVRRPINSVNGLQLDRISEPCAGAVGIQVIDVLGR